MDKNIEKEIRILVKEEMTNCFKDIQSDVSETKNDIKEIKRILVGDTEYESKGIVKQIKENTEYINTNKTLQVVERAKPAIDWYEDWSVPNNGYKTSRFDLLSEMMSVYGNIKWLVTGAIGLGIVNVVQIVLTVIEYLNR